MTERRLMIMPEKRLALPKRAWQVVPVVGAALALTWGISRAVRQRRRRRAATLQPNFIRRRRILIMRYRVQ